jgi:sterol desaturase/sphingolipid hydroxylase (fatty acid hydroxylase superfamily)
VDPEATVQLFSATLIRAGSLIWNHAWQLALFAIFLITIESLWPAIPEQRRWRVGSRTDLLLSFINPLFVHPFNVYVLTWFVNSTITFIGPESLGATRTQMAAQPFLLQFAAALLIGDFLSYWKHRIFHTRPLWRIHAVHHLTEEIDWLSNDRDHPLQLIATHIVLVTGLVLIGFSNEMIALQALIRRAYSLYTHANVGWSHGPLSRIFVSPTFHRRHHMSAVTSIDRNFAVVFSLWDVAFGTYYAAMRTPPTGFGVPNESNPATWLAAMKYPFVFRAA